MGKSTEKYREIEKSKNGEKGGGWLAEGTLCFSTYNLINRKTDSGFIHYKVHFVHVISLTGKYV